MNRPNKTLMGTLEKIVLSLIRYPRLCLFIIFAFSALLMTQLKLLTFDASSESFLNKSSTDVQGYSAFQKKYGLSAYFIILIKDKDIFSTNGITQLRNLEHSIKQQVPNIESIESIANGRFISSDDDNIIIDSLFPDDLRLVNFVEKKKIATTTPYYLNRLINSDGDVTAISLKIVQQVQDKKTGKMRQIFIPEMEDSLDALYKVINQHQPHYEEKILLGGSPTVTAELTRATKHDLILFSTLAITMVAIVLFAMFRRFTAVLLPLTCLVLTIFITLSLMSIGHFPIQATSSILPSFLLAICVGDTVHFLKTFYVSFNNGRNKIEAITDSIRHCGEPMFYTTFTVGIGLASFATSDLNYVISFGIFSCFGVWLAFFLTMICLPCMILVLPMKPSIEHTVKFNAKQLKMLDGYLDFVATHFIKILFFACLVLMTSMYLTSKLTFSHNPLSWFPKDNPVRLATLEIEKELAGSMQAELLIHNKGNNNIPLTLAQMTAIDNWLASVEKSHFADVKVHSAVSILNVIKEVNKVLNPQSGYGMPDTQDLLAQELLLISLNDTNVLNSFSNDNQSELRVTISIPWQDSLIYAKFLDELTASFNAELGNNLDVKMTGLATVANNVFANFAYSMGSNFMMAGAVVILTMIFLFNNIKLGVAMALPNALPIFMVLAFMFLVNLPLDLFTMLIGDIAVGLVVDDTIHFTYAFQHFHKETLNTKLALHKAFESTGVSLIVTTVVLSLGFLIYTASSLNNLTNFGLITALCLVMAILSDFIITPAVLYLIYSKNDKIKAMEITA